jgi:hypothetical protein
MGRIRDNVSIKSDTYYDTDDHYLTITQ